METSDPFDLRLDAVNTLGGLMKAGDEAQVIAFAGNADQVRDPVYDLPSQFYDIGPGFSSSIDPSAVNQLAQWENGGSPLFDAVIHGLGTEGIMNASNLVKVVIVITDGLNDNASTLEDAIQASTDLGVPVYAIGLGDGVAQDDLISLASQTGGLYSFVDGAEQLNSLMGSIHELLSALDLDVSVQYQVHYTLQAGVSASAINGDSVSGEILVQVGAELVSVPWNLEL